MIENRWRVYASMIEAWRASDRAGTPFRVLDAGCGDGINLLGLQTMASQHGWPMRLVAMDYNPVRLRRAQGRVAIPVQQASLYALPYGAGSFDVVLCSHILEHVPDLSCALAECRRILAPTGLLIVAVPNEGCAFARLRNNVLQPEIGRGTDHVHFFTASTLTAALAGAGFRVMRVERETFFFPISYVTVACNEVLVGHVLMRLLRTLFPSQAGGLMVAAS